MRHRGARYTEYAVLIDNEPSEFDVDWWAQKIDKSKKKFRAKFFNR